MKHMHFFFMFLFLLVGISGAKAIDVSQDFANIKDRQYFLRVGLVESTRDICITPLGDFYIHDQFGAILYRGSAGTVLDITCRDTGPSKKSYYAVLNTFEPNQLAQAEALTVSAKARTGQNVIMRNDPRENLTPSPTGGLPPRMPRLIVGVGPCSSRWSAQKEATSFKSFASPTVIEVMEAESRGRVEARDAAGRLVAQSAGYLGIWPKDRDTMMKAYGPESFKGAMGLGQNCRDGSAYRGLMEVWVNLKGQMTLANRVFIEHYLYGVLPGEVGNYAPLEAKMAQAVISRSAAIAKLRQTKRHEGWNFDFCDEQHCQVYTGAHREEPQTNRAVDGTMGQVCTYHNEIIDAVFSQCCGGITCNNEEVWEAKPHGYLRARVDSEKGSRLIDLSNSAQADRWIRSIPSAFCNPNQANYPSFATDSFRWSQSFTAQQALRSLVACGSVKGSRLIGLQVTARSDSGRVSQMTARTDSGSYNVTGSLRIRQILGLKSSLFSIQPVYSSDQRLSQVSFDGMGRGHGVGLCQLGATMMGHQGYNYIQILKHYYEGIDIYKIYK